MIAHSFRGEVFGPAQRLHGATYVVDAEVRAAALDEHGLVIDIGLFGQALREALEPWRYRNLDELEEFSGRNTTTEFLAAALHRRLGDSLRAMVATNQISTLPGILKITLAESHIAWASFEAAL
jgi:6-pyruvoyl-tetrahydropterin synthase